MRGMGSIRQLPSGAHRASIYIAGEKVRKTWPTPEQAKRWLKAMRLRKVEVEAGVRPRNEDSDLTYAALQEPLVELWEHGARVYSTTTLEVYKADLERIVDRWGPRRVASLRTADVDAWVSEMRARGLSSSRIRNQLNVLSAAHKYAVRAGLLADLPCRFDRPRPLLRSVPAATSEDELGAHLEAARFRGPRVLAVVLLAADAGLRRGEIARLRGEDVLADQVHVALRSETDRPKAPRGRTVPILTDRLRAALAALDPKPGRPLLGEGTTVETVRGLAAQAGVRKIHQLRHRFVTALLAAGTPPAHVQKWAGHSSLLVTQRYLHVDPVAVPDVARTALAQRATGGPRAPSGGAGQEAVNSDG
jgi:integrase